MLAVSHCGKPEVCVTVLHSWCLEDLPLYNKIHFVLLADLNLFFKSMLEKFTFSCSWLVAIQKNPESSNQTWLYSKTVMVRYLIVNLEIWQLPFPCCALLVLIHSIQNLISNRQQAIAWYFMVKDAAFVWHRLNMNSVHSKMQLWTLWYVIQDGWKMLQYDYWWSW